MRLLSFLGCAFGALGFIFCLGAAPAQADGAFADVFLFCGNSGQSQTSQGGLNSVSVSATTSNSGSQPSFGCASSGSATANLGTGSLQGSVTNGGINPLSSQAEASFEITGDVLLPATLSFASIALREVGASSFTGSGNFDLQVIITNDATGAFGAFTCVGGLPVSRVLRLFFGRRFS